MPGYPRKTEASKLAPIGAVSFLCCVGVEAEQKDLAESGTKSLCVVNCFASNKLLKIVNYLYDIIIANLRN